MCLKMIKSSFPASSIRWAFNICDWSPTMDQWKYCLQCVPEHEVTRCNRFVYAEDCKSSLIGQLLMRKAVNISTGIEYDKITFSRTQSGKPFLVGENQEKVDFNLSHNGDFCVLAAEKHFNVGVDVMKTELRGKRPIEDFFITMQKQFSASEWSYIMSAGLQKEQLERFFRLWCLKESYVKAKGTGITVDLQTLSFSCLTPIVKQDEIVSDTTLTLNGALLADWKFEEMFLDTNHYVAVALGPTTLESKPLKNELQNFTILTFEELMKDSIPFNKTNTEFYKLFQKESKTVI
ncbi:L-aminoadipate-semialdehyde dehydrogenase-phosphopantetheinyl transferase-like [Uloborus diversus]|uniref:L-aminoadipate-semialdehyde dehydrogenase-phosphopantetheinyl transferase-like n=1 Tax=Uloborus diversus TaxID=327109 RepID=UPI00240A6CE8|nr:L-aminoadipate-semialdehyde dehydrogenase-phosphopantetheinyl transferase-like [Uloborus diversus]